MSRTNLWLTVSLALVGCTAPQDEFKNATPAQSAISLVVPASATTQGASSSALLGEKASLYKFTRDISAGVNGGVLAILSLVDQVTDQPPSSRDANKAVWGPYTGGLSPATWLLVVQKTADHQYDYVLSGKPRGADDSAYKPVMAGHADVVIDDVKGAGSFLLDFSAIHALDDTSKATGGIAVHYSNLGDPRNVEVAFDNFVDDSGSMPSNSLYRYAEHPDHSGNFEFVTLADIDGDGATKEVLAVLSRWTASGSGRSDADATGGSLGGLTVHVEECWDASFDETYYTDNLNINPTDGDPASCAF